MKLLSNTKTLVITLTFISLLQSSVLANANKAVDPIQQKIAYVSKADSTLEEMKKDTADITARIRFAPHKNHRKIEYLVEKLQKEQTAAETILADLRIAPETEWASFKPRLDTVLKDMNKDRSEAKGLLK